MNQRAHGVWLGVGSLRINRTTCQRGGQRAASKRRTICGTMYPWDVKGSVAVSSLEIDVVLLHGSKILRGVLS